MEINIRLTGEHAAHRFADHRLIVHEQHGNAMMCEFNVRHNSPRGCARLFLIIRLHVFPS